jgi:HD-GYP domain-containing protein (c-di-GMP phosphodiesterase class II)
VHVCDIYDALSTNRPYRKPWNTEQVLNDILERATSEVDPSIAQTFAKMVRDATVAAVPLPSPT